MWRQPKAVWAVAGRCARRADQRASTVLGRAAAVLMAAGVLAATRSHLVGIDVDESELDEITEQATAITVGSD